MIDDKLLFALTIHTQPLPKERARAGVGGHFTPERTRTYEGTIRMLAQAKMAQIGIDPIEGDIRLVLGLGREGKRRADLDNLTKSICDGLNGVVYKDDRQIIQSRQDVIYGLKKGRGVIYIMVYCTEQNPQRMDFYKAVIDKFSLTSHQG